MSFCISILHVYVNAFMVKILKESDEKHGETCSDLHFALWFQTIFVPSMIGFCLIP